jgi:hypothetical protein
MAAVDARACLTPFCQALRVPDGGWSDLRLTGATMMLAGFGDGYAFESVVESARPPQGSLPEVAQTVDLAVLLGIDAWCSEHGHSLPGLPSRDAKRVELDLDESNEEYTSNVEHVGLNVDLAPL